MERLSIGTFASDLVLCLERDPQVTGWQTLLVEAGQVHIKAKLPPTVIRTIEAMCGLLFARKGETATEVRA